MKIAVFGALGRTGSFVTAELRRRGHTPVAIVRDERRWAAHDSEVEMRVASLHDKPSLLRSLRGAQAVIHCAGPFLDTAEPIIEAALSAGIHYLDITAEQGSAQATLADFAAAARRRDVVLLPSAAFYGGLADLMATAAMGDWTHADRIDVAIALDSWWPTLGTRLTGARNTAPRLVCARGILEPLATSPPKPWRFPDPFGMQDVVELPFTETILITSHLRVSEIHNYINQAPLRDLRDPATPAPVAADERGRSNQTFVMDVVVRNGNKERRGTARGRDIYAATAPIAVEAAERVCDGGLRPAGAFALGELFEAADFLNALRMEGELFVEVDGLSCSETSLSGRRLQ